MKPATRNTMSCNVADLPEFENETKCFNMSCVLIVDASGFTLTLELVHDFDEANIRDCHFLVLDSLSSAISLLGAHRTVTSGSKLRSSGSCKVVESRNSVDIYWLIKHLSQGNLFVSLGTSSCV